MAVESGLVNLAVVPIVFNAGAAVLPAVLAGLISVMAIMFKPSQWGRVSREKPWVPAMIVLALAGGVAIWAFWPTPAPVGRGGVRGVSNTASSTGGYGGQTNWTSVALAYLRQREQGVAAKLPGGVGETATEARALIYRMDINRSGYAGGPAPRGLKPLWTYIDGEDDFAQFLSSVIVTDRWVYGASCTLVPPASNGSVFCLDAKTGERRWINYQAPPPGSRPGAEPVMYKGIFSSPALTADGKYLVVGQGLHLDRNSSLLCFDTATGELHWQIPTPLHIEGSPAIEGDIVVAGAGAVEVGADHKPAPSDDPGFVMGVRISDGTLLWKYAVNDPESSPAIDNGIAYIGSGMNGSAVVALRIADDETLKVAGQERLVWRTQTPHPAIGAVTLTDELVLIGCGKGDFVVADPNPAGVVLALDKRSGTVAWQVDVPDAILAAIAVRGDMAVVPVRNGELVALSLSRRGEVIWRQRVSSTSPVMAGPTVTDKLIYAVSSDGQLAVLNAADGTVIEKHYLNRPGRPGELGLSVSSPVVANGAVYVGSETGGLHALTGEAQQ